MVLPYGKEHASSIAIIGLSCRFPGDASTPSRFWDLLKNGKSGYSDSTERYHAEAFAHPQTEGTRQNVIPTEGGYMLKENPYVFDAGFFNITATEATSFDPRQRLSLEVAYEALENAGITLQAIAGTKTACFMGTSMSDYRDAVSRDFQHFPKYHILGVSDEMIANRVSHFLDIHGPSATVQSACSSSLVATHVACQSLRLGESEMAIAGGVGLVLGTEGTMHLTNLGFLNPKGHSRSFDADAGGYGRGEGCGIIVMKRLEAAIRDGDNIRSIIRASGVNSDGWTQGVTFPSLEAQTALVKQVYEDSELDYSDTQYVEAHGTGTKAGDPVEARAIATTIGQSESRKQLYVGSVKPNIGHLEAAAGIASIIKGTLALEHGLIPPNLNFSTPNPDIPLDDWKMIVPTKLTPWPPAPTKRMSISGFGMGGTNGHIVMEAYKPQLGLPGHNSSASRKDYRRLFTFSSHDKAGFSRIGKDLADHLDTLGSTAASPTYLANLAHTLGKARSGHVWRGSVFAETAIELREQITTTLGEDAIRAPSIVPRIGFIFTGQGAQWARMGIEMLGRPIFANSVATSAKYLKEMGCDWDPVTELSKDAKNSQLGVPKLSQPICSVLQIALVDELRSWGVTPSKVCGHSSGEIAAAYTLGALSHRDALAAAYFRGIHSSGPKMDRHKGGMMAVGCSREDAQKYMDEFDLHATVACVNSPSSVTISGDVAALEVLREKLDERSIFARRLKVDVAYHSPHMHGCSMDYYSDIAEVRTPEDMEQTSSQAITMVSSVSGHEVDVDDLGPYYWVQNLISPVLFTDALHELVAPAEADREKAIDLLIEIGPHSALGGPVEQILAEHGVSNVAYTSMLTRGASALDTAMDLAAQLFARGVPINAAHVNGDLGCRLLTDLPPYAWNHSEQFRADGRLQREQYAQKFPTQSLLGAMHPTLDEEERIWRHFITLDDEPWLRGHMVGGTVLFPAAGMVSIALEAAQQIVDTRKTPTSFTFRDISFLAAMALPENTAVEVIVSLRPHLIRTRGSTSAAWWEFTVSSCLGPTGQVRNNCRGLVSVVYSDGRSAAMEQEDSMLTSALIAEYRRVLEECPETCHKDEFYDHFTKSQMQYGAVWQGVESCHPGSGQAAYQIRVHDIGDTFTKGKLDRPFLLHAATLDAAWQGYLGSTCCISRNGNFAVDQPMVPVSVGELEISATIPGDIGYLMPSACRSHPHGLNEISADMHMFDKELSRVVLSTVDYRLSPLEVDDDDEGASSVTIDVAEITSDVRWELSLDLLQPGHILSCIKASTTNQTFRELARMILHQQPALQLTELVGGFDQLSVAVAATLPAGVIHSSQVHYAVLDANSDTPNKPDHIFGSPFALGQPDATVTEDRPSADLILVPQESGIDIGEALGSTVESLLRTAKPGAYAAIAAPFSGPLEAVFKEYNFQLISSVSIGADAISLFKHNDKETSETSPVGAEQDAVTILQPTKPSPEARAFSEDLQDILKDAGHTVEVQTGDYDVDDQQSYISLLELEEPLLEDMSEPGYEALKKLILGCKRLLWVTSGVHPSFGIIEGLFTAVNVELGEPKLQVLHLTRDRLLEGPALVKLTLESKGSAAENVIRERNGLLQVPRLYRGVVENQHIRNHLEDSIKDMSLADDNATPYRLTIGKPGMLDTLHYRRDENSLETSLADHELELVVKATGVNFRDIMACMGLVTSSGLGVEGSGIVLRAGNQAANLFKPGDRVSTLSLGGMHATKTRCDYRVTAKLPDSISFEEGAAAATVHATANFALIKLAKLRKGQSVLIHAAAGGVGQAAIQLAQQLGLIIYTTVGTEDKRRFLTELYGIPDEHIFNSRDSSFAKGISRVTDGQGVDCVLNSLSGELLRVSWTCLATFGTFVEIGTRDINENMRLDMEPFGRSVTFSSFDIPTSITADPTALGEALNNAFRLLGEGSLQVPAPLTVYPAGDAEQAFRTMQQGRHRGKIVLSFSDDDTSQAPVLCQAKDSLQLDPEATYLIIGGLGGLGRSLSKEFVASGARHIAFLSRSGDSKPEAKATIAELASLGAEVKVARGDVSDQQSFLAAMGQYSELPSVKGVVQMAMVLRDGPFENMSYDDWRVPLQPKVQGTWNLHEYFGHQRPLDFMIFCSSLSGISGSVGQSQYGAGNTYLDSLAHFRRAQGLKAVSVNLGLMLDAGVIHEMEDHTYKQYEDSLGIREPAFHALMKSVINGQQNKRHLDDGIPAQIATGFGTADIIAAHGLPMPPWMSDIRFGPLAVPSSSSISSGNNIEGPNASLASRLTDAGAHQDFIGAAGIIVVALAAKLAEILRIPTSEIDPSRPLYTYGVDSLVALEVRNWVSRELKARVPLLDILAAMPMSDFAASVAKNSKFLVTE